MKHSLSKNATTKAAQAVKQINSPVPSGTDRNSGGEPAGRAVEHLRLPDAGIFIQLFQISGGTGTSDHSAKQDEDALHRIQKMIAPFILRRLKKRCTEGSAGEAGKKYVCKDDRRTAGSLSGSRPAASDAFVQTISGRV